MVPVKSPLVVSYLTSIVKYFRFPPKTIGNHVSWDSTLVVSLVKIDGILWSVERSTRFVWQTDSLTDTQTDFIICPMQIIRMDTVIRGRKWMWIVPALFGVSVVDASVVVSGKLISYHGPSGWLVLDDKWTVHNTTQVYTHMLSSYTNACGCESSANLLPASGLVMTDDIRFRRLRYYYFRFRKTNGRHIGILLS